MLLLKFVCVYETLVGPLGTWTKRRGFNDGELEVVMFHTWSSLGNEKNSSTINTLVWADAAKYTYGYINLYDSLGVCVCASARG